jgi:hypothetical protein
MVKKLIFGGELKNINLRGRLKKNIRREGKKNIWGRVKKIFGERVKKLIFNKF